MRNVRTITANIGSEESAAAGTVGRACLTVTLGITALHLQRASGAPLSMDSGV
jgi:hypothetical protein